MTADTARNGRPPQDSTKAHAFWRVAVMILLFNVLLVVWVLIKPGSDAMLALVVNSAQFVGPLLVVPLCFGRLLRLMWRRGLSQTDVGPAVTRGQRWAPILLGLGILCWVFGQALFTFYEWVLGQPPPLPSIADVGYLSVYPFFLLGILLLPALSLLALGLTLIVVADSNFAYWSLHETYATGTLPDVGWSLGYMLVALGAFAARLAPSEEERTSSEPGDTPTSTVSTLTEQRVWTSLLPYVLVPAVGVLVVYAWRTSGGGSRLATGVYIGGAVLISLMLLLQVFTIVENARLYNRLQRTHRQVEQKNDQLVRSQSELRRQKE